MLHGDYGVTKAWSWHRPEEIVAALEQAAVMIESGMPASVAIATLGLASATYFRWRKQYGGLSQARLKEIAELKKEVSKLRRALAELEGE